MMVAAVAGIFTIPPVCADAEESGKSGPIPDKSERSDWHEWITRGTDAEWLRSQWSKGSELAKSAKASLSSINADELKRQCSELNRAIEANDFSKVTELTECLAKKIGTEKFVDGMRYVVIRRQKGGEAATKAIEEYSNRKDLNDLEKAAAQNLKSGSALLNREDVQGHIVLAIFFACECKLGAHQGGLLAVPIISILFPDYLEKNSAHNSKPAS
jgi:hypothetical protein